MSVTNTMMPMGRSFKRCAGMKYTGMVDADAFDEAELYTRIVGSGARALLIGRRAVIAWGVPVITADYDLWIPSDDAEACSWRSRASRI